VLISISLNSMLFAATGPVSRWVLDHSRLARRLDQRQEPFAQLPMSTERRYLEGQVVLVGYGRVGATVAEALARSGARHVVVEEQDRIVAGLRRRGEHAIHGDATRADVLERAGIAGARLLVVTAPEPFRARRIVEVAREASPHVALAVRTHSAAEQAFFEDYLGGSGGHGRAVYAEREAALSLAHYALLTLGESDDEADGVVASLRAAVTAPTEMFRAMATRDYQTLTVEPGAPDGAPTSDQQP